MQFIDFLIFRFYGKRYENLNNSITVPFNLLSSRVLKKDLFKIIAPDEKNLKLFSDKESLPIYDAVLLRAIFEIYPIRKAFKKVSHFIEEFGVDELRFIHDLVIAENEKDFYSIFLYRISQHVNKKFKAVYKKIFNTAKHRELSFMDYKYIAKLLIAFDPKEVKELIGRIIPFLSNFKKIIIKCWEDEKGIKIVDDKYNFLF